MLNRKCSCRVWEISGIPCPHAVCAIFSKREEPMNYVSDCFRKETHRAIYTHFMVPVVGKQDWPKTGLDPPLPPFKRKMPGRPKKHARREQGVVPKPPPSKISKSGQIVRCSVCRQEGHNKTTCLKNKQNYSQKSKTSSTGQSSNQTPHN
ncbi:hypothetical protein LUZ60_015426 [Juncus effusus]|nr:hypothetical protein LUZ60_015426 [Juncus effusus]